MSWRLASSLVVLRNEINTLAPRRSKASDGAVGDLAHQKRSSSDHNPNNRGVVCAIDVTHDPAHGADMVKYTEQVRIWRATGKGHPALKYMIFRSRLCSAKTGWRWTKYSGTNPHNKHAHFSVGGAYDSKNAWKLRGPVKPAVKPVVKAVAKPKAAVKAVAKPVVTAPVKPAVRVLPAVAAPSDTPATVYKLASRSLSAGMRGTDVAVVQRYLGVADDGIYGPPTAARVRQYQTQQKLTADGVVGPFTWKRILHGLGSP
jgi:hypothetical protein